MQELRLVAVSEDGSYLVLATAGRGTRFTLPVDDRLRAAVRGHFSRLGQFEIEVESPLRPKEIQARIRAGETAEEIAESAGIPIERVRWFEGPVLQEREYMAQQAQRVTVRRQGETTSSPPLGEMVEERLGRRGVDLEEVEWDSWKCEDSTWRVRLSFFDEGRPNAAEWIFDPRRRQVSPLDEEAAALCSLTSDGAAPAPTVTPLLSRRPAMKIVSDSRAGAAEPRRESGLGRVAEPIRRPAGPSRWEPAAPAASASDDFSEYERLGEPDMAYREPPREDVGAVAQATGVYVGRPVEESRAAAKPTAEQATAGTADAEAAQVPPPAAPAPRRPAAAERRPATAATTRPEPAPATVAVPAQVAAPAGAGPVRQEPPAASARPTIPGPAPAPSPATHPAAAAGPRPAPAPEPAEEFAASATAAGVEQVERVVATGPGVAPAQASPAPVRAPAAGAAPASGEPAAARTPAEPAATHTPAEPAAPRAPAEPAAPRGGRRKAARGKRASVPSWDEIMFGARRPD